MLGGGNRFLVGKPFAEQEFGRPRITWENEIGNLS
jgi:hypothetical protein